MLDGVRQKQSDDHPKPPIFTKLCCRRSSVNKAFLAKPSEQTLLFFENEYDREAVHEKIGCYLKRRKETERR